MTVRSSDDSDEPGHREGHRHRAREIPIERARRVRPEKILNDVSAVSADHDELAVRHVDDAHQAVGDRKAERGKQQNGSERHAGEEQSRTLTPGEPAFDVFQTFLRFATDLSVLLVLEHREQQRSHVGIVRASERVNSSQA